MKNIIILYKNTSLIHKYTFNMIYKINIINYTNTEKLLFLKNQWNIEHDHTAKFSLIIKTDSIELKDNLNIAKKNIWVNFNYKKMQLYQNDRQIKIIQAIGVKKQLNLNILDATAGFGKDAFIFFSYGCRVTMLERNPIIAILLYDGLIRSYQDYQIGYLIQKNMQLIHTTAFNMHQLNIQRPDVIYLDPMFPAIKKHALSKKTIRAIQNLVGYDTDSDNLLLNAIPFAKKRIVVKRPKKSNYLANIQPNHIIQTKNYRFDVYIK